MNELMNTLGLCWGCDSLVSSRARVEDKVVSSIIGPTESVCNSTNKLLDLPSSKPGQSEVFPEEPPW